MSIQKPVKLAGLDFLFHRLFHFLGKHTKNVPICVRF